MSEERLRTLEVELARRGGDVDLWRELARLAGRLGKLPASLRRRAHLPRLLEVLAAEPGARELLPLVEALTGLEVVRGSLEPPGPRWVDREDVAADEDHLYDRTTGLALRWRRVSDGAEMILIPADPAGPALLLDRAPVTVGAYARFVGSVRRATRPLVHGVGPEEEVRGLELDAAERFAGWAGARLPRDADWRRLGDTLEEVRRWGIEGPRRREPFKEWLGDRPELTPELGGLPGSACLLVHIERDLRRETRRRVRSGEWNPDDLTSCGFRLARSLAPGDDAAWSRALAVGGWEVV